MPSTRKLLRTFCRHADVLFCRNPATVAHAAPLKKELQFSCKLCLNFRELVKFARSDFLFLKKYAPKIAINQRTRFPVLREDYEIAEHLDANDDRDLFYTRIKSAAETGWDFSSRWFIKDGGSHGNEI